MAFADCISHALNDGVISHDEADDLMRRWKAIEDSDRFGPDGFSGASAKRKIAEDLQAEGLERKRRQLLQAKAAAQIERDLKTFAFRNPTDIVKAIYSLFEDYGTSGFQSARFMAQAMIGAAHSELANLLQTFRRSALTMKRFNRPLLDDVLRARFGESTSPEAKAFADSIETVLEKLRLKYNEAGGAIGKLQKWGLPQSHDASALLAAGLDKWRDHITPLLDWDALKYPVTERSIPISERAGVLEDVWKSAVTDGWDDRAPSGSAAKGALWANRIDHRFLKFKDADSWLAYSRAYGRGDPFAILADHIRSMSRDIALMQRFGPNPEATNRWLQQVVAAEGARQKIGVPSMFADVKPNRVDFAVKRAQYMIDGLYSAARGGEVPYSPVSTTMAMLRNVSYAAKLGSSVINHTFANPVIQMMGRYLKGHSVLSVPLDVLQNLGPTERAAEIAKAGMVIQDAMHTLERGAREQGAIMRLRELSNWLPAVTTHYSGLEAMVEANRRAAFMGQMSTYAQHLTTGWGDLPARLRETLGDSGLSPQDWADLQKAKPYAGDSGAPILRFQDIAGAAGLDPARGEALSLKYLAMLHSTTEALVPSSNWMVRASMHGIDKLGGIPSEIAKSAMMFKGGFMATFMLSQWRMIQQELARRGAGSTAAYVGASAIGLTLAGMMTLQTKNLINGKDTLSMDPTTKQGRDAWAHAALTSGALGIYGDFIASDRSSFGHDMLSTLAGPMVTQAEDAIHSVQEGKDVALGALGLSDRKKPPNPEGDFVRFLRNETPMLSTHWALRLAYNRLVLDQLQYLADPQAHMKMRNAERKVLQNTGQGYWWQPGATAPDRLPGVAAAR